MIVNSDDFLQMLIREARDTSIFDFDKRPHPHDKSEQYANWTQAIELSDFDALLGFCIPDCVDTAVANFLIMMEGAMRLHYRTTDDTIIDTQHVLCDEIVGHYSVYWNGWIFRYSKQRFYDPYNKKGDEPRLLEDDDPLFEGLFEDGDDELIDSSKPVSEAAAAEFGRLLQGADQFGQKLVEHVRDTSILRMDACRRPGAAGKLAEDWQGLVALGDADQLLYEVIPDIYDVTLITLLQAMQSGKLRMLLPRPSGGGIDMSCIGNLAEGYMDPVMGAIKQFSKQRVHFDRLADFVE